jgi:hypothetical protein
MSDNEIIGAIEAEETDLATHTKLCHMRYLQIINKFDSVDTKFDKLEALVLEVKEAVDAMKLGNQKDYLKVTLYIIGLLLSVLGFLVVKFVI